MGIQQAKMGGYSGDIITEDVMWYTFEKIKIDMENQLFYKWWVMNWRVHWNMMGNAKQLPFQAESEDSQDSITTLQHTSSSRASRGRKFQIWNAYSL